ncbi:protein Dok-7 isoform X2 [Artibeus jamaicensis]|uniref:protein Dok-7 isoform X2 n=1 Tax=Artibeus jamaicensis TaxID=9417 RepID=UPI00235ADAF3|nr:protein Dok-7 isoform X2 [Artibeus jamaicensis]
MTEAALVEGQWKSRWLVLRKPSPVADCLLMLVYKDRSERARGLPERSSQTLERICGLEPGLPYEGLAHTLAVLCLPQAVMLGFDSREAMCAWDARIRCALGEVHRFHVTVAPGTKLESGPATLHLCNDILVVARDVPPVVTGQWKLSDLRRYGAVPNGFIFEGGTRCGYWAGVFFLSSAEGERISFLFDCIVRGVSPTKGPFGLRPLLPGAWGGWPGRGPSMSAPLGSRGHRPSSTSLSCWDGCASQKGSAWWVSARDPSPTQGSCRPSEQLWPPDWHGGVSLRSQGQGLLGVCLILPPFLPVAPGCLPVAGVAAPSAGAVPPCNPVWHGWRVRTVGPGRGRDTGGSGLGWGHTRVALQCWARHDISGSMGAVAEGLPGGGWVCLPRFLSAADPSPGGPAAAEERVAQEALEALQLEKRLSLLSHLGRPGSGGDDRSLSSSSSEASHSDVSASSRLAAWPEQSSSSASTSQEGPGLAAAQAPGEAVPGASRLPPEAPRPRQLREVGRQSSSDSGIATGSHSSYSGSFSSCAGSSLDVWRGGEELGSLLSLPQAAGAPEPSLCACPPGTTEYQVPSGLRPHYDTPRSLRPAPRDQTPAAQGGPDGSAAGDPGGQTPAGCPSGVRRRGQEAEAPGSEATRAPWEAGGPHVGPPPAFFSTCPACGGLKGAAASPPGLPAPSGTPGPERPSMEAPTYANIPASPSPRMQLHYLGLGLPEAGAGVRGEGAARYAQIDLAATAAAHRAGTQHAQAREERLAELEPRRKGAPR